MGRQENTQARRQEGKKETNNTTNRTKSLNNNPLTPSSDQPTDRPTNRLTNRPTMPLRLGLNKHPSMQTYRLIYFFPFLPARFTSIPLHLHCHYFVVTGVPRPCSVLPAVATPQGTRVEAEHTRAKCGLALFSVVGRNIHESRERSFRKGGGGGGGGEGGIDFGYKVY